MAKRTRIRSNKKVDAFLTYKEDPDLYLREAISFDLPRDPLILLKHLTQFSLFVRELSQDVHKYTDYTLNPIIRAEERSLRMSIDLEVVFHLVWEWYLDIYERVDPLEGRMANARLIIWSCFCTLFYLLIYSGDEGQGRFLELGVKTAADYDFCRLVQGSEENVIISDLSLLEYSLSVLWRSMRFITPSLYRHAFCPEMKEYFYALFFRYTSFLSAKQVDLARVMDDPRYYGRDRTGEENHSEEEDEGGNDDRDEEYGSYKKQNVPLAEGYHLKSEYFYEGEAIFTGQIRRLVLSGKIQDHRKEHPLVLEKPEKVGEIVKKLVADAVRKMVGDQESVMMKELRQTLMEDFKKTFLSLYLYHGEVERYRREKPNQSTRAGDVLSVVRKADLVIASEIMKRNIADIVKDPALEKESVLLCKITTRLLLEHNENRRSKWIDKHFMMEEMVSQSELEEAVKNALKKRGNGRDWEKKLPLLIRLVGIYYVLFEGNIYESTLFVECYMIWISLLMHRSKVITPLDLHPAIRSFVQNFITITPS